MCKSVMQLEIDQLTTSEKQGTEDPYKFSVSL